jgi:hypothetical protein
MTAFDTAKNKKQRERREHGNKKAKTEEICGFAGGRANGNRTGTEREQIQIERVFQSITYKPPCFFSPSPLAFAGFCLACPNRWRWCPVLVF